MLFRLDEGTEFEWKGVKGRAFNTRDHFSSMSSSLLQINGNYGLNRNTASDKLFFVIRGRGEIIVEDEKFPIEESDCVVVEKGKEHDVVGDLTVFVVNTPAFAPNSEIRADELKVGPRKMKVVVEAD